MTDTRSPAPQLKPWISAISPYVPGRATTDDGAVACKLSSNENPLGTSIAARDAFRAAATLLERYPEGSSQSLRDAIGTKFDLDPARIICGVGSDELLNLAAASFAGPGDEILIPRHGFSAYWIMARRVGATPVEAADNDYGADVDALLANVTGRTRILYLANPNNPTGTFLPRSEVERLHAGLPSDCLLVIDQAYAEYLSPEEDDGGLALAHAAANVLVTRTFSKIHGLAAERIGWAYGAAPLVQGMHRIRAPFNVTTAGQGAAVAALSDETFIAASAAHNRECRDWFEQEIAKLAVAGLRALPSKGNFVLVLFEGRLTAETAFHGLMRAGFIVRWFPGQALGHCLRITIGTRQEMEGVVEALNALSIAG
ncbi:histidinol-phosphate transaminase [Sphingomonas sp. CGMCC 1.13654]|uniref:Histidinol-phosphate aminotransferase n=1 Tax=Sphingomonas chungangi TaxID=2683589 RepID=A0A838L5M3_9SPHN|nr:histidinol-phosphate transaminase [Sphingomonas chungangi]MBA2933985.1 histidinol-phosphate transaminase [Sphingomonas chungangi]MVW57110.1 histidinol-phosphate transaminase [Sphingomonas chungangi]